MDKLTNQTTPLTSTQILTTEQKELVFENMSDGVLTVDERGLITYANSACAKIFHKPIEELRGQSIQDCLLANRRNRAFNHLIQTSMDNRDMRGKTTVRYFSTDGVQHLSVDISLIQQESMMLRRRESFQGMIVMIEDITAKTTLRQHEHDCAYIFAGLVFCISTYLFAWSMIRFTLGIHLRTSTYTLVIEAIAFALFLEIIFCTSLSMRDIGLLPKKSTLKKNIRETAIIAVVGCLIILCSKLILQVAGIRIKGYFIGGSLHGAYIYIYTAFVQEFLARGVIQTCVKSLMKVKFQKFFGVLLTSLLFALMHMPFGSYFMIGAFLLSLALGYVYERHENIWSCAILHWACGYLAMCLFF